MSDEVKVLTETELAVMQRLTADKPHAIHDNGTALRLLATISERTRERDEARNDRDGWRSVCVEAAQLLGEPDFADVMATADYKTVQLQSGGLGENFKAAIEDHDKSRALASEAQVAGLRANQRTVGTVEACSACMFTKTEEWAVCAVTVCPIRGSAG